MELELTRGSGCGHGLYPWRSEEGKERDIFETDLHEVRAQAS